MKLQTIFEQHNDKFTGKWKHYFDVYERYLERFVGQEFTLLEIGTSNGGSLQVWKKYFGDNVRIVGVDIDPRTLYEEPQIETYCGNQSDGNFWMNVLNRIGQPDVIIDDGSHDQLDVLNSFSILFPQLKNNGVYVIEDIHTAYNNQFSGGITSPLNFVSIAGRFVHDVNLVWMNEPYAPVVKDLKSVSFYDSMVVMEKETTYKKEPCYSGIHKVTE